MSIEATAETAEQFLINYIKSQNFFTPEEDLDVDDLKSLRLAFFRAVPHPTQPGTLMYTFVYGREFSKGDPELDELGQQSMDALKQAHPEVLQYKEFIHFNRA